MPIIRENKFEENPWILVADDEFIPQGRDVIISFQRLKQLVKEGDRPRSGRLGVALDNSENVQDLKQWLDGIDLIQLSFPAFTDGRAYSQARILRIQLNFDGDIRATGDVLVDQAHLMERCGFSSFEISDAVSLELWEQVTTSLDYSYQCGYELKTTEIRSRHSSIPAQFPTEVNNENLHI